LEIIFESRKRIKPVVYFINVTDNFGHFVKGNFFITDDYRKLISDKSIMSPCTITVVYAVHCVQCSLQCNFRALRPYGGAL